jgi:hypothetical protein
MTDCSYKPSLCFPRPSIHLPRQFPLRLKKQTSGRPVGAQVMPWEGQSCSQRKAMPLNDIELDNATFVNGELDRAELEIGQGSLDGLERDIAIQSLVLSVFSTVLHVTLSRIRSGAAIRGGQAAAVSTVVIPIDPIDNRLTSLSERVLR